MTVSTAEGDQRTSPGKDPMAPRDDEAIPQPYRSAAPIARYLKVLAQMVVGTVAAIAAAVSVIINFFQDDPAQMMQAEVFSAIGVGLAVAAAIELAYTLFTDGPDEALDPIMLGVAAALIFQLGKVDAFDYRQAIAAVLYIGGLAGLFSIKRWLATISEPKSWSPSWGWLRRRSKSRTTNEHSEAQGDKSGPLAALDPLSPES